jgi:hypothetical protein
MPHEALGAAPGEDVGLRAVGIIDELDQVPLGLDHFPI